MFTPILMVKIPILTHIFSKGLVQPPTRFNLSCLGPEFWGNWSSMFGVRVVQPPSFEGVKSNLPDMKSWHETLVEMGQNSLEELAPWCAGAKPQHNMFSLPSLKICYPKKVAVLNFKWWVYVGMLAPHFLGMIYRHHARWWHSMFRRKGIPKVNEIICLKDPTIIQNVRSTQIQRLLYRCWK